MAVEFQYELPSAFVQVLVPTALTIWDTHDGPPVVVGRVGQQTEVAGGPGGLSLVADMPQAGQALLQ